MLHNNSLNKGVRIFVATAVPGTPNTGCPIISDPTLSIYKMIILGALWSEILDLEISLIYILLTTSGF